MNRSDPKELLKLRSYLFIKHHVTGRLRVAFSARLLDRMPAGETARLQEIISGIPGVCAVRLNLPARSAVVSYDPGQILPQMLVDLIEGDEMRAASALETMTKGSARSKT